MRGNIFGLVCLGVHSKLTVSHMTAYGSATPNEFYIYNNIFWMLLQLP